MTKLALRPKSFNVTATYWLGQNHQTTRFLSFAAECNLASPAISQAQALMLRDRQSTKECPAWHFAQL